MITSPPSLESELANLTLLSIPFPYWVAITFTLSHLALFLIFLHLCRRQITIQ